MTDDVAPSPDPGPVSGGAGAHDATSGPVGFGFNLGKIPDQGEDSDPILRAGPSLGLLAVFDGMGGAGGTVYETDDGPRTGAYIGSRIARDVVERHMVDLLQPDWPFDGRAAAEELQRVVKAALGRRLAELKAPKSGLRSKLLRALPTTMALVALQRKTSREAAWAAHVLWSGDSRAYVFDAAGAHQLTTDDLRDPGDAMENLRHDSVVGNAMSADVDFGVNHRRVDLEAPFLVVCATDGCFGYVPSPMHFEHLVLSHLMAATDAASWSAGLQADIEAVTGDDAAMSALAVGTDLRGLQELFASRTAALEAEYLRPMDAANADVAAAQAALAEAQRRAEETTSGLWQRYKPGYERHLGATEADDGDAGDDAPTPDRELRDLLHRSRPVALEAADDLSEGWTP